MEKILREILTKDKSLLGRRDELIEALDEKIPGNLRRDFTPIKKALSQNIGEKFLTGAEDKEATKIEVMELLKASGMQAARINFVVETFVKALDWDKPSTPGDNDFDPDEPVGEVVVVAESPVKNNADKQKKVSQPSITEMLQKAKEKAAQQTSTTPAPQQPQQQQSRQPLRPPPPPQQSPQPKTSQTPQTTTSNDNTKKILIGFLCVVTLGILASNGNKNSNNLTTPNPSTQQVQQVGDDTNYQNAKSELSLNGMDLGISVNEATMRLGNPMKIEEVDGYERYIYPNDFYIAVINGKVDAFVTGDPKYKTLRGLHVGSTYDEVIDAYGTNSKDMQADNLTLHEYPFNSIEGKYGLLRFAVNTSGRVEYISIRTAEEAPSLGENWIKDSKGVYLWNPEPQEGESITWSGSFVQDGNYKYAEGNGIVKWYNKNGEVVQVDEGNFKHGQRHGKFRHTFKSGNVEFINWDNGKEVPKNNSDIDENVKQAATAFVAYHKAITNKNFSAAFDLFTDERKSDMDYNIQAFARGYSDTITSEITDLSLVSKSPEVIVLDYVLDARDRAGDGRTLYQQFRGRVVMRKVYDEWKIASTESKRIKEVMER